MSVLRNATTLSRFTRFAAPLRARQVGVIRPMSSTTTRTAQGYGDGEGDPKGENPQDQGSSSGVKENAEHPGPKPPSEGQGTGGGPTKGGSGGKSPEDASASSGGARSKEAKETGSSPTGGEIKEQSGGKNNSASEDQEARKDKHGNVPKIQPRNTPGGGNDQSTQDDVDQHNKEFEQRYDRAPPAENDKVDKRFWEGNGGGAQGGSDKS